MSTYACLSVQDNGHGIGPSQLENIFEPFFTTKEVGKGTGLGLSMVFGSVKSHNGFIEVDSKPGHGSTFRIFLPLLANAAEVAAVETSRIEPGKGETILLADDEQELLSTTAQVLSSLGYRVISACDGEQAMKLFADTASDIDLILTDIVMPKMSGPEFAALARGIKPGVPVIFATGYNKEQALGGSPELKNSRLINKPFAVEELSQTLREMLSVS